VKQYFEMKTGEIAASLRSSQRRAECSTFRRVPRIAWSSLCLRCRHTREQRHEHRIC